jgi:hypothetical protein
VSQWQLLLLEAVSELFTRCKQTQVKNESQVKVAELFLQIGKIQMELEWLNKNHSCCGAHELQKLVDDDQPELRITSQFELQGQPRSTLYRRPNPLREATLRSTVSIDQWLFLDTNPFLQDGLSSGS